MSKKKKENQIEPQEPETAVEPEVVEGDASTEDSQEVAADKTSLELQLEESRQEAQRNYDLYLRSVADLENYRRRAQREKEDLSKFANERILREILPVIDNLERAVEHARQDSGDGQGLLQGVEMTLNQFGSVLEKFGVTPVTSIGKPFDPAHHEAVGQLETDEHPPNAVAQELQKGYLLHERLLRPSMVMVARAPATDPAAGDEGGGD